MLSKISNLTPGVCSELLHNGTVKTLVLLLHSQNAYLQVGRKRMEIVEKYMKKTNLRKNIAEALSEIINGELELASGVEETTSGDTALSLELTHSERLMISKFVEKIRNLIHRQHEQSYASNNLDDHSPPTCSEFSSLCFEEFRKVDESIMEKDDYQRHYFEQIGGYYVLLDLLRTHVLFHDRECIDGYCQRLMESIFRFFEIVCYTNRPHSTDALCRQIAGSPFYTTLFVNVIRNFWANGQVVMYALRMFVLVCERMEDFETLHYCRAIPFFADMMMKAKGNIKDAEFIIGCMFRVFSKIFGSNRVRMEFHRIEGAVEFVISKFAEHYSWARNGQCSRLLEGYPLRYVKLIFTDLVTMMVHITHDFFSAYPEVQEIYRKYEVSTIMFNIIKETLTKGKFYQDDKRHGYPEGFSIKWFLDLGKGLMISNLCEIVQNSESELDKVRQLADPEFLEHLSAVEFDSNGEFYSEQARSIVSLLEKQ